MVARIKLNQLCGCENKDAISDAMKQNLCSEYKHTLHHIFPGELLMEAKGLNFWKKSWAGLGQMQQLTVKVEEPIPVAIKSRHLKVVIHNTHKGFAALEIFL